MSRQNEDRIVNEDVEELTLRIARANHFQPGALQANRQGALTTAQQVRFLIPFAASIIVGLSFTALLIFLFAREADRREGAWWLGPLALVIIVLSFLLLRRRLIS